ncbi:MAG: sulfite exporter TauE/SafE family protein [Acidobacteriia bacterium]|nr:sulfite exporter TauE/SafE family protein [Terriglobia bacterium]
MFIKYLLVALSIISGLYVIAWLLIARSRRKQERQAGSAPERPVPNPLQILIGFVANFLDTLGIGSFATTTSMFKLGRLVPDEQVPGTLNVGHALPTITEAFIYMTIVQVSVSTLLIMIVAAVLGSWIGAGIVARWPRRNIQISMGLALLAVAGIMALRQAKLIDALGSGTSLGLDGYLLWLGAFGNFMLGALMTIGIGLYAPCMALVYMLGMQPLAAYPIMMGSCAFLMPVGSVQFIRNNRYSLRAALGLTLGGIPGVLLAAFLVKTLPLEYVIWLVVGVVVYTATRMLHSARVERMNALPATART